MRISSSIVLCVFVAALVAVGAYCVQGHGFDAIARAAFLSIDILTIAITALACLTYVVSLLKKRAF
jgi:hypothetical protein